MRARYVYVAIAAAGVLAAVGCSSSSRDPSAVTLAVPPVGNPVPTVLPDGSPVFVVHHPDDTLDVFLAASTNAPHGLRQLLGWCPRIAGFDDGMSSATWDARGRASSGPAPSDLASFEIVERSAKTVTVGSLRASPERSGGNPPSENVPFCSAGSPGFHADSMVFPQLGPAYSLDEAIDEQPSGMVRIDGAAIVATADGFGKACDARDATSTAGCSTATLDEPTGTLAGGSRFVVVHGNFLAHVEGAMLSDLIFINGWTITGKEPDPPSYCGSFDVDAARRVSPQPLVDGFGCLRSAFNSGQPALLELVFTDGEGNRAPTYYEIDGGRVRVQRQVDGVVQIQICSALVADHDGRLVPERCEPA